MTKKLLFCLIGYSALAQSPIPSFYGLGTWPSYIVATAPMPVDQSPAGANAVWNFDTLVELGSSESQTVEALPADVATFPNTTLVNKTNTILPGNSFLNNIYFSDAGSTVSITGVSNPELTLNFTNNATLGAFPMDFGFTNSDTVAGTFAYTTYEGSFSGTIETTVDGYGTLSLNLTGLEPNTPIEVTRLKTTLNLSLTYIIPNVGTIVQTTYSYYSSAYPGYPIFRSTTNDISVPLAGIDQENTTYESFLAGLLNVPEATAGAISLEKNPVSEVLKVIGSDNIQEIIISDMNGRIVAQAKGIASIDVSRLDNGVYLASITNNKLISTKKFIKH